MAPTSSRGGLVLAQLGRRHQVMPNVNVQGSPDLEDQRIPNVVDLFGLGFGHGVGLSTLKAGCGLFGCALGKLLAVVHQLRHLRYGVGVSVKG